MAIDQTINPDEETMEIIYKVVELAGHCITPKPYQRPDMGYVVNILSPLVGQWKPACPNTSNGVEDIYSFDQSMSLLKIHKDGKRCRTNSSSPIVYKHIKFFVKEPKICFSFCF